MTNRVPVEITEKAVIEINKIRTAHNISVNHGLRLGVRSGGCCGVSYLLGFEEKAKQEDIIYETGGISIFIDPVSSDYLAGAQLDFRESEMGSGFVFNNVNQEHSPSANGCSSGSCETC